MTAGVVVTTRIMSWLPRAYRLVVGPHWWAGIEWLCFGVQLTSTTIPKPPKECINFKFKGLQP